MYVRRLRTLVGMSLAQDAAKLLLEMLPHAPDTLIEARAHQTLDWIRKQAFRPEDVPVMGPLPGEAGWDARASGLLLGCVEDTGDGRGLEDAIDAALSHAAELGLTAAIPVVLERGARVQMEDFSGLTPLARAVRVGHTSAVDQLLEAQNGIDLCNTSDGRAVTTAIGMGRAPILRQLLSAAINVTPERLTDMCITVAVNGDERLMDVLLDFGANPTAADANGLLPVVVAAEAGNLAIVERLAQKVPLSAPDGRGVTALMAAASRGHVQIIDLLADLHVDAKMQDSEGRTALEIAADAGKFLALTRLSARFGVPLDRNRHTDRALTNAIVTSDENEIRQALIILGYQGGRSSTDGKMRLSSEPL
jgi:ankyrin repeat protein